MRYFLSFTRMRAPRGAVPERGHLQPKEKPALMHRSWRRMQPQSAGCWDPQPSCTNSDSLIRAIKDKRCALRILERYIRLD